MTGIEKLTERIAQDSDQETKAVLDRGRAQAEEILNGYQALSEAEYAEAIEQGRKNAAERIERMGSVAQLDGRKMRLAAKQEMLTRAFAQAREKLLNLPDDEYSALLAKLAVQGSVTGKEALVLSVKDRPRFGKKVVVAANEALAQSGRTAELTLSEESRDFEGGLYVQADKVETNCTFDTILRMLRETMVGQVAEILFAD